MNERVGARGDDAATGGQELEVDRAQFIDELERPVVSEFYQRSFGQDLPDSAVNVVLS